MSLIDERYGAKLPIQRYFNFIFITLALVNNYVICILGEELEFDLLGTDDEASKVWVRILHGRSGFVIKCISSDLGLNYCLVQWALNLLSRVYQMIWV